MLIWAVMTDEGDVAEYRLANTAECALRQHREDARLTDEETAGYAAEIVSREDAKKTHGKDSDGHDVTL